MRLIILSFMAGLVFMPVLAVAEESDFGASMFQNEAPAALSETSDDILSEEADLLGLIEPAAGEPSVLDDGWMPATMDEKRLAVPDDPVVPGMDTEATAE